MWKWAKGEEGERAGGSWWWWGRGGEEGGWDWSREREPFVDQSGWKDVQDSCDPPSLCQLGFSSSLLLSSLCLFSPPPPPLRSPPLAPGAFLTSSHSPSTLYLPRLPAPIRQPPQDFMIPLNDRWDALDSTFSPLGIPLRVPRFRCRVRGSGSKEVRPSLQLQVSAEMFVSAPTCEMWHDDKQTALWTRWSHLLGEPTCLHSSVSNECSSAFSII